jgi:hypothetical protein
VTSLLGLIVFPYQEIRDSGYTDFKKFKLEELSKSGWPTWKFGKESGCDDLQELIRHLRNAVSHRRVILSSDARKLEQVDVLFFDRKNPNGPGDWDATINAAELHVFVLLFARFLEQSQHDYS